jgi:L-asparagine transporter-like permease
MAVMSYALFWIPVALSVIVLRRKLPLAARPYRVPLYPLVPLLFALVMVWIVVSALHAARKESIATLVLILLGLPLYPLFRKRRWQPAAGETRAAAVTPTPAPRA